MDRAEIEEQITDILEETTSDLADELVELIDRMVASTHQRMTDDDFRDSETYKKVMRHRATCKSWLAWRDNKPAPLCLQCFGGGLTLFIEDLARELKLSKGVITYGRNRGTG